jgi:rSAM/selenodomain-associated transferase 1
MSMQEMLLIFTRFPEPGKVKTRLIPKLGSSGAAVIYRHLAEQVVRTARSVQRDAMQPVICVEPARHIPDVSSWLGPELILTGQVGDCLGERLSHAFEWAFAGGASRVVAIGTDCIELSRDLIAEAFDLLARNAAVLGPATDGGYYLIGLSRPLPDIFREIPWSTDQTFAITSSRLASIGVIPHLLPPLNDIDTWDDLNAAGLTKLGAETGPADGLTQQSGA